MRARVQSGLDRIASGDAAALRLVRGRRLGLLAHPASVDSELVHAHAVLERAGCDVRVLFGPEHGYGGEAQDMIAVESDAGAAVVGPQGPRVHSLYGSSEEDLAPKPEQIDGLDAVVIDLQDVGSRYYTFVWTAALMLRACAQKGVQTIVLDRPNPLGGELLEGGPQRPGYRSFVGLYDVAVRHGMTIGELCQMVCERERLDRDALSVLTLQGYARSMLFEDTGLPWVLPSPNMPTCDTARVYPGGCLLEGTNLSEGRGTTRPFEIFGAPYLDGAALAKQVPIEGAVLRPLSFEPTFQKHGRQRCGGVQVHITDVHAFRPYAAYVQLIAAARKQCGAAMAFRTEPYEFVSDRPAFDLLTGGPELRQSIERGDPVEDILHDDARAAVRFAHERAPWLLYP